MCNLFFFSLSLCVYTPALRRLLGEDSITWREDEILEAAATDEEQMRCNKSSKKEKLRTIFRHQDRHFREEGCGMFDGADAPMDTDHP